MKLNHQELAALEAVALRHFPTALVVDVSEVILNGGLGYVMASVKEDGAPRGTRALAQYLIAPNGDTYTAEVDRKTLGYVRGDQVPPDA